MNYRHAYHAGNFADVFKHILLISLIESLKKKEKPFCYLDTHAGAGEYDLEAEASQKTLEYKSGISKIMEDYSFFLKNSKNNSILEYIEMVKKCGYPKRYPGSPKIAQAFLRPEDRMVLMERHKEEAEALKKAFKDVTVSIHHQDGYEGLKAHLPPKERRGLILIDPPYENEKEWDDILLGLESAFSRFANGIYAIWYPIKDKKMVSSWQKKVRIFAEEQQKDILFAELSIYPEDATLGLLGCGMAVLNPPWEWEKEVKMMLPFLWERMNVNGAGSYRIMNGFPHSRE